CHMRFQRLVLQSGNVAFTLPLHHRLTVIGGVGRAEREGLVGELLGALAGTRRGVRLEICDDAGRRLVVERGARPGRDRVAEAAGASAEDAPLIEAVEERHAAFEAAQSRHESFRHNAIFIGGASALGAVPAALLNRWTAIPFLAVALLTTLVSIIFRRRMQK